MRFIYRELIVVLFLFMACRQGPEKQPGLPGKDELMQLNKAMVREEQEQITDYINRYGYNMQMSQTGLHFMHILEGKGKSATLYSGVTLKYTLNFLDGTYVYSSDSSGLMQFTLGRSEEPSGLQEGLLHMKEGGKALIIVPSYLAYGITGDENRIGPNQTLVYNVELLKVSE